ncbi:MAG: tetratricopeptide repeat protein [Candidatus Brocadiales bacterium]
MTPSVTGVFVFYLIPNWFVKLPESPKPPDNLLVVIANFEPINEEAKEHCKTISERLEGKIREKIKPDVPLEFPKRHEEVIKGVDETEKSENAKKIGGDKYGAHLILWGSVGSTKTSGKEEFYFEPRITVANKLGSAILERKQPEKIDVFLSEPEILKLRRHKIEETTDIVSFIHGLALYDQLKYEDAIILFKGIKNPDADVCFYHGTALGYLKSFDEAIEQLDKAIEKNPRDAYSFNNRGNAYYGKGAYDRAMLDYNKALEINPRFAEAYYNRGTAYLKEGDYDRAIGDYNKALELNPRFAEAYANRGEAYRRKDEYGRAIGDYSKAIEINPRLGEAFNNRAVTYYSKQEYGKAWDDVHSAQGLGYQVHPEFLKALREASGRE